MEKNFSRLKMPPVYKRNGKECYLDPVRKKLIYITPEETVRQKVISYLIEQLNVPQQSIVVEQHLSHYGINSKKRADIVVHEITSEDEWIPVCVVECKASDVYLDDNARDQLLEYCDLIGAEYALLINGEEYTCYKYDEGKGTYINIEQLPKYDDMIAGKYDQLEEIELPERIQFEQMEAFLREEFESYEEGFYGYEISAKTPMNKALPAFNLLECLLDTRVKLPVGKYGMFEILEDYGVRMLTYGNGSGGKFYGPYRSFLVKVNGNVEFYSISITTYSKSRTPDNVKTCICVAHDDEESSHHALQLVIDDNMIVDGKSVEIFHHGKIAVGRCGSGKIDGLRQLVLKKCPKLLRNGKFYIGKMVNDRLWRLDDNEVMEVIENLISYAIIRDEYREIVKNK